MTDNEFASVKWRASKALIIVELGIVGAMFVADWMGFIPFSKTVFLVILVLVSLWLRRAKWRDIGFGVYRNWTLTLMLGILGGTGMEAIELFVSQPALVHLLHSQPDLSDFKVLHGNLKLLVISIVIVWTVAAFGEEIVYRGYLMNRITDLFAPNKMAPAIGLMLMSVIFGFAHSYQGATGIIDEGFMGLLLRLMFLGSGRNLLIPIVAHGVQDTIDVVLLYLGSYPMPILD